MMEEREQSHRETEKMQIRSWLHEKEDKENG